MKNINDIPPYIGAYIAGFVDGEESFNVSFCHREDHVLQWKTVLTFNVAQRDKTVLALMKQHLGCGRLQGRRDGVWYYVVSNPQSLGERVIPFFERFGFLSAKSKRNFALFKKVARLMIYKKHLTREGLEEIAQIRELINEGHGRTRKYTIDHIMNDGHGNPQRLYAKQDEEHPDDIVRPHERS